MSRLRAALAEYALAIVSGLLLSLSFPNLLHPDFFSPGPWIALLALVPLLRSLEGSSFGLAFRKGYVAAFLFFLLGTSWINEIRPMGPIAFPAWLALSAWLALFIALFSAIYVWARKQKWVCDWLWAPALWTLLELARERLLTGFPWISLGSSQAASALMLPLAAWGGVYILHFAVFETNLLLYKIWCKESVWGPLLLLTLLLALRFIQPWKIDARGPSVKVAVIQGNINEDQEWTENYRDCLMTKYFDLMDQARAQGASLLIWPEGSFPGFYNDPIPERERLEHYATEHHCSILLGSTLEYGSLSQFYNAALLQDPDGETQSYLKRHLVPLGEYLPLQGIFPILDRVAKNFGLMILPGPEEQNLFSCQGLSIEPVICYESIYGELVRASGIPASLISIITLDTWFGDSMAPRHHFLQAALRAVENGTWVARAAATGISGFIGPDGRVRSSLALDQEGFLVQEIPIAPGELTFYKRYGPCFPCLCLAILLLIYLFSRFRGEPVK